MQQPSRRELPFKRTKDFWFDQVVNASPEIHGIPDR
jgi:hypothetical protein